MNYTTNEEAEHRRMLLRLAAKGNARARKELAEEYHAYVYSAAQIARYIPKIEPISMSGAIQRKIDSLLNVENDAA